MPDIAAVRPASGEPIASAWGTTVHDMLEGIQVGSVNVVFPSGSTGTDQVVTFPRAYTAPPRVFVQTLIGSARYFAIVSAVTATTCTVTATDKTNATSTATVPVQWLAIGTPA